METFLDALQWPAMLATLVAAWLVASERQRRWGFWCLVVTNVLWSADPQRWISVTAPP